ncbi:hydroxyisourate hydrolase, partial [Lysinibacillus sp. GbtcB16]|uniref:hydroxyisourate hydrolase n=1 Tax=Lysinibacillus sp. GbtcB16 TaxID=2824761 RepID=UPI001C30E4CB
MSVELTTHVLDISQGRPAKNVRIDLYRLEDGHTELLRTERTNADGRLSGPMLSGESFRPGTYELLF